MSIDSRAVVGTLIACVLATGLAEAQTLVVGDRPIREQATIDGTTYVSLEAMLQALGFDWSIRGREVVVREGTGRGPRIAASGVSLRVGDRTVPLEGVLRRDGLYVPVHRVAPELGFRVAVDAAADVLRLAPMQASQPTYPFPGRAEDLASGHYWHLRGKHWSAGAQEWAYDLLGVRFDAGSKSWTTLNPGFSSDAQNESKILYGKRIYAISDGEVFACWRNAPENPGPGKRHPQAPGNEDGNTPRISFAGNFLFVEMDNGERVLYAHFQPGTIPAALCPHTDSLFQTPVSAIAPTETRLAAGNRPQVNAGQFLGRVGNSGNSSEPHLHIHIQTAGNDAVELWFRGVWVKSTGSAQDSPGDWAYLNGGMLPLEPTAILPPYSPGFPEVARHGVHESAYQFAFEHIYRSGYRPVWVNGYEVNGQAYYNVLFRPADGVQWVARHGLTSAQYQTEFDKWTKEEGYRPLQVDSYSRGSTIRYAAIFVKQSGPTWTAYHGKTTAEHQQLFDSLINQGYRPVNIALASAVGGIRVAALYEQKNVGSFVSLANIPAAQYQARFDENHRAGRQLVYLNAWRHGGALYFSAIWNSATTGTFVARHGLTAAQYQTEWETRRGQGRLTQLVTGYLAGGGHRFAALWRP